MKLLLDTSVFLWLTQEQPVPRSVRAQLEDEGNSVYLSLVTPWEMQIKVARDKLKLGRPVRSIIDAELSRGSVVLLPITLDHIESLSRLPDHHRDPFDRLLIAQALAEDLTLVSADREIARYPVPVLWD